MVTAHVTDATRVHFVAVRCHKNGTPNYAAAQLTYAVSRGTYDTMDWGDDNAITYDSPLVTGSKTDLTVTMPMTFKAGWVPGTYDCQLILTDSLNHDVSYDSSSSPEIVSAVTVTRTSGIYDDDPPVVVSLSFDRSSVEVGAAAGVVMVTAHVTDATRVHFVAVRCHKNGTPNYAAAQLTYAVSRGTYDTMDWGDDNAITYDSPLVTGSKTDLTVTMPMTFKAGWVPGTYDCQLILTDSLNHDVSYDSSSSPEIVSAVTVTRTPPGLPSAPQNLGFDPTGRTAGVLSWGIPTSTGSPALTYYVVQYRTGDAAWADLPSGSTTQRSIAITGLRAATDYSFRIRGENGATESGDLTYVNLNWGQLDVRTPNPVVPSAPTTFAARSITTTTATVSWTAPTDNGGSAITDYVIETSRDGTTWSAVPHTASTSTSMNLSGLAPGTTYQVRIATKTAVGTSETLTGSFTTVAGLPSAPQNLAATSVTGTTLTLTWDLPTSNGGSPITDYKIEVSSNGGSTWSAITHAASNSRAFNVTGLAKGTNYRFRVSTITTVGTSSATAPLSVTTLTTNPAAPTTFAARSITTTTATVSWTAPTDNGGSAITDYVIETSRDGTTWSAVPHTASTSTSMNLSGLAPGTTYQVRIATKTAVGTSETLTGSFTTVAGLPSAPQNLAATSVTGTTLTLTWDLPTSNGGSPITDYKIEVSSNGGSTWSAITHAASNSRAFNVTGLAKGTNYRFRVSTITTVGTSAASAVLSVTTVGNAPASPTSLKVTSTTTTTVTLSWSQATVVGGSAVRNYIVEYSTNSGRTWTVVTKSVSTSKSLKISGFRTKSTYRFRVKSVNDVGVSGYSNAVTVTTR